MKRKRKWLSGVAGAVVVVFGFFCLNCTNGSGYEHHRAWAAQRGLPPPSRSIFYAGVGATALGAGLVGVVISRR